MGISLAALAVATIALVRGERRAGREERRAEAERRRRRALGPAAEQVRQVVIDVREQLTRIALGSILTVRAAEAVRQSINDAMGRVGDEELAESLRRLSETWAETNRAGPKPQGPRAFRLGAPYPQVYRRADEERAEAKADQMVVVVRCRALCDEVLARLNALDLEDGGH